jgi:hypothetical protein
MCAQRTTIVSLSLPGDARNMTQMPDVRLVAATPNVPVVLDHVAVAKRPNISPSALGIGIFLAAFRPIRAYRLGRCVYGDSAQS